jgi:hypothetical protein
MGRITDVSGGLFKKFGGTTDDTGKATYSWTVSDADTTGKYKTTMEISAHGFENNTASKTFKVSPVPVTTPTTDGVNIVQLPPPNGNNNSDQNHPSTTTIQIPRIHIPTIRIPFHLPFQ